MGRLQAGDYTIIVQADGRAWSCALHLPSGVDSRAAAPLVLVLHGTGENGRDPLQRNGWLAASDQAGIAVAAPDALPLYPDLPADAFLNPRIWNNGQPLLAARAAVDDL